VSGIAHDLNQAWRDPDSLDAFLTKVFLLCVSLPKAVGFTSVALFVDNIEYSDVTLLPHEPFNPRQKAAIAVENLKIALGQASFLVASETVASLYDMLRPMDENSVDLLAGIDVVTLYDAAEDLGSRTRYDFAIQILGEAMPLCVDVGMCGGIITYLAAWDDLHHTLFQLERVKNDEDKFNQLYYQAVGDAQRLVEIVFEKPPEGTITVCGVKRDPHKGSAFTQHARDASSGDEE
jgi:hypothetical protein